MVSASQAVLGLNEAKAAWHSAWHAAHQALTVAGARPAPLVGLSQCLPCLCFRYENGLST